MLRKGYCIGHRTADDGKVCMDLFGSYAVADNKMDWGYATGHRLKGRPGPDESYHLHKNFLASCQLMK